LGVAAHCIFAGTTAAGVKGCCDRVGVGAAVFGVFIAVVAVVVVVVPSVAFDAGVGGVAASVSPAASVVLVDGVAAAEAKLGDGSTSLGIWRAGRAAADWAGVKSGISGGVEA
jgi:hypothetical protein